MTRKFKTFYFFSFATVGCFTPYFSLVLADKGLNDKQIGYVSSVRGIMLMLVPLFWGWLFDRRRDPRRILGAILFGSALGTALLWFSATLGALLLSSVVYCFFSTALQPLWDGYAFRALGDKTHLYSGLRVWGSVGFVAATLALWIMLRFVDRPDVSLELMLLVYGATIALCFGLPPLETRSSIRPVWHVLAALRNPHFALFMAVTLITGACRAVHYTYTPRYFQALGLHPKWQGVVMSFGVLFEILFILKINNVLKAVGMKWLLVLGMMSWVVRLMLQGLFPSLLLGILLQSLHGPGFGLLMVGSNIYVNDHMPGELRASAQALLTMAGFGFGTFLGNVFFGWAREQAAPSWLPESMMTAFGWAHGQGLSLNGTFILAGAIILFCTLTMIAFFKVDSGK
ncbi:MAG TPA: MFS transporter [Candidatus Brocadiia bacterium]|nr:MFS transporter [Candidatus Brocadiia bacterium]